MNTNSTAPTGQTGQTTKANPNTSQNSIAAMKQHRDGGGSANFIQVIATYTGIMPEFVIITYYLKKLTGRKKKKTSKLAAE